MQDIFRRSVEGAQYHLEQKVDPYGGLADRPRPRARRWAIAVGLVLVAVPAAAFVVSVVAGLIAGAVSLVIALSAVQTWQGSRPPPAPPPPGRAADFGERASEQSDRERALQRARRRWHQSQRR